MSFMEKFFCFCLVFLIFVGSSSSEPRKFEYAINADCNDLCKDGKTILGHVQAIGPNDTIHYLWDFSQKPTILLALTSSEALLQVDWKNYLNRTWNSVKFSEKPYYSFGVVINRIFEFNDLKDEARINITTPEDVMALDLRHFKWTHENMNILNDQVTLAIKADSYSNEKLNDSRNGTLRFWVDGFNSVNHSFVSPHMLHSENSTQIGIVIDNLDTFKNYTNSRFAFEVLIVSENNADDSLVPSYTSKLDDEFTPGIFEVSKLLTPEVKNSSHSAYFQWRPVSYLSHHRDVTVSTEIIAYKLIKADNQTRNSTDSLLHIYYGKKMFSNLAQKMNISIGDKGDGFYKSTRFSTWTLLMGYGIVPSERLSTSMITVIAAVLMAPLIMLSSSVIYICVYKNTEIPHAVLE